MNRPHLWPTESRCVLVVISDILSSDWWRRERRRGKRVQMSVLTMSVETNASICTELNENGAEKRSTAPREASDFCSAQYIRYHKPYGGSNQFTVICPL